MGATKSNQLSYEPPLIKDEISIWSLEGKTKKKKSKNLEGQHLIFKGLYGYFLKTIGENMVAWGNHVAPPLALTNQT